MADEIHGARTERPAFEAGAGHAPRHGETRGSQRRPAAAASGEARLDAELVARFLKAGRVSARDAARAAGAPLEAGAAREPLAQLAAFVAAGLVTAPQALLALIEHEGIVDYDVARGIPFAPRLLRLLPREVARRLPVLPTVASRDGLVLVLAGRPLEPLDRERLEGALGARISCLAHPEDELREAIDDAYKAAAERGYHAMRVGEILVREGLVAREHVERARARAREEKRRIGEVLLESGRVDEATLFRIIAAQRGMALVSASEVLALLEPSLLAAVPPTFLRHSRLVPYRREGGVVRVATSDPLASPQTLSQRFGAEVRLDLIAPADLERVLVAIGSTAPGAASEAAHERQPTLADLDVEEAAPGLGEADAAALEAGDRRRYEQLADRLLAASIRERASDLHLETYEGEVLVRLRVDGVLHDFREVPLTTADLRGIINVTKVRSGLDISERRLPQGGRMRRRTAEGALYDFRVQTQPALQGEHLIVRLLSQSAPRLPLLDLGFSADVTRSLERLTQSAGGLVVISGPTGSGKTTTLYALLDRLRAKGDLKIVTAEDPIEYALPRVQQCQVRPEIGYTFAGATRAFLRQDPDVILVGETRDLDTAIETIRASQTGHLVLTTLHANDAVNSIRRLVDIGLDPASVSSELLAVLAQRLLRRVCDGCRAVYRPDPAHVADLFPLGAPEGVVFTRGAGCPRCRSSGYLGRTTMGELWETGERTREAIARGARPTELRDLAFELGMKTLMDDACEKIAAGVTTFEEAIGALPYAAIGYRKDRLLAEVRAKGVSWPEPRRLEGSAGRG